MEHMVTKVAEYAVILDAKNRFLMIRLWDEKRQVGGWHLPGGRLDEGEQSVDGLKREVREETGLEINVLGPIHTAIFGRPKPTKYAVFFVARSDSSDVVLEDDEMTTGFRWFSYDELDDIEFWQPVYREVIEKAFSSASF